MHVWQRFCLSLLAPLLWTPLVVAEFYIDNANSSVEYYSLQGSGWTPYGAGIGTVELGVGHQVIDVDYNMCYNENYCLAACMAEDECQAKIPFAGTGITIYVLNAGFQGVNASLSVDGTYSVNGTVPPPTPPSYQTPRVSLLAIQSLPYAYHVATLSILDWDGGNTSLYFDYALIEDANIQTTTSQPPTPAPPASSSLASTPPITMFTMAALPTTSTTTTMRGTTGTTTAVASHTSASSSSASSCSNCLRAIEIAAPCVISALLAAGIIFYLKSRRAKAKKEDNRVAPFTDMPSAPLPSIPAAERKARMRAAQSWVLGVHTEAHFSDRPSVRDGLLSEGSSGVGRESPTCGGGSEESDEIHINDRARSAASGVGPSAPLSDTVVALQSSPTQSHSAYGPPPSYR